MKLATLILATGLAACATGASAQQEPPRHNGPPQEFFDACKGKKEGDSAQAKTPRGETMSGKCRMVLMPDRPAGDAPPERERPRK